MFIDEKGAVLSSFSQSGVFPYRLPGDLVLLTGDGGSFLCGTDGSLIKEYPGAVSALTGEDCFILAGTMYDSQGTPLYEAGDLADVAPFKGRAVYAENDVYGIRGTDGEVLCPARFAQIFQLTEEGFYAMEQGSRQVGLYDDAGGLLEEARAQRSHLPCFGGRDLPAGQSRKHPRQPSVEHHRHIAGFFPAGSRPSLPGRATDI